MITIPFSDHLSNPSLKPSNNWWGLDKDRNMISSSIIIGF